MINRRILLYVVALATLATVVLGLVDRLGLAIAAMAIAAISMFVWVVFWARALNGRLARITAEIERGQRNVARLGELGSVVGSLDARLDELGSIVRSVDARLGELGSVVRSVDARVGELGSVVGAVDTRLGSTQQNMVRRADAHDETLGRLRRDLYRVHVAVQRTPSLTTELGRVYRRLVHHDHPMPELGGWAMTSATLVWAVEQIASGRVSTILECGSGSSTVWFALALEQRGTPGGIVSLESSPEYADETRARLEELGLAHRAQVLTAPLVDLDLPGRATQRWFDPSMLPHEITDVDLLFVDGPVGDTSPQARYPALPVLADRLTDNALVLLDDTNRADETQIIKLWSAQVHGGRRYEVVQQLDRATVLRGVRTPMLVRARGDQSVAVSGGDVMRWADRSRGRPFSKDPSVVRFGDRYLMYYSIPPKHGENRWGQAVAASDDLSNWETIGEIEREGEAEAKGLCAGGAIVLGDRVHLFYQTYGRGRSDAICHASSADGVTFERSADNPIIRATGGWNCGRAIDAEAHVIGDELFCYWATRDPQYKVQMLGVHSASLASDLSARHWRQRCTQSILKPELPWEGACIEAPTICRRGDTFVMFYAGSYNNEPQQIGVAFSQDGLAWERMGDQPFLANGRAGEWNSSESGHPGIFIDPLDGATWLFYQGNDDRGRSSYLSKRRIEWDGHTPRLA